MTAGELMEYLQQFNSRAEIQFGVRNCEYKADYAVRRVKAIPGGFLPVIMLDISLPITMTGEPFTHDKDPWG